MKIKIDLLYWIKSIQEDNDRKYDKSLFLLNQAKLKLDNKKDKKLIDQITEFIKSHPKVDPLEIDMGDESKYK